MQWKISLYITPIKKSPGRALARILLCALTITRSFLRGGRPSKAGSAATPPRPSKLMSGSWDGLRNFNLKKKRNS